MKKSVKNAIALFSMAAIMGLSSVITFPISSESNVLQQSQNLNTIPFTLQNMVAILAGILLGVPQGPAAVGIFLLLGVFGLPVFSGGTAGVSVITGYTGGFLVSYYLAAFFSGAIAKCPNTSEQKISKKNIFKLLLASFVGFATIYVIGTIHYIRVTSCSVIQGIQNCILPFLLYDGIKLIIVILISTLLRPIIAKYLYTETKIEY